jgi:hypothetical protein
LFSLGPSFQIQALWRGRRARRLLKMLRRKKKVVEEIWSTEGT